MKKFLTGDIVVSRQFNDRFGIVTEQMSPPDIYMCIDIRTGEARFLTEGSLYQYVMSFAGPVIRASV